MAQTKYEITVAARSAFLADQSDVGNGRYVFAYTITITNTGTVAAQLLSRHWIITDAEGRVREVRGPGVVGEQPMLAPGESFTYTSACPLDTPFGTMHGSYQMVTDRGETFDAEIAPFLLGEPHAVN